MNQTTSALRNRVQEAFARDDDLQDYGIEIIDNNGVITLTGTVPTQEARDRAEAIAQAVEGVSGVINEIDVV